MLQLDRSEGTWCGDIAKIKTLFLVYVRFRTDNYLILLLG
ncbi:hypothetical protein BCL69_104922 [Nitrosomonas communis]|uniref:Uncharacterized protein n=1 Tax=Nitrosomonas communis TaxID=44574 RepID=A0A5D3YAK8_9PROT|nr:hypothetical protein BCL69_104922 [Nitrosomonas communis]